MELLHICQQLSNISSTIACYIVLKLTYAMATNAVCTVNDNYCYMLSVVHRGGGVMAL